MGLSCNYMGGFYQCPCEPLPGLKRCSDHTPVVELEAHIKKQHREIHDLKKRIERMKEQYFIDNGGRGY